MKLENRTFGTTGIEVYPMGFGAGHIGSPNQSDAEIERLLDGVLDLGINLIDTARGYNLSEERIGMFLSKKRSQFILSTKVGYGIEGYEDWTYDIILAGIDHALKIMRMDYIDIVHLHSCPIETLQRGEVIEALCKAKEQGKIRCAAYSGENEALSFAISSGMFDSIECSANICDQRVLDCQIKEAAEKNMGVIAKRPIANAPWRYIQRPVGEYVEVYWERWKHMNLDLGELELKEVALRFIGYEKGIHNFIIGSSNLEHLQENIKILERGPLDRDMIQLIKCAFQKSDDNWIGQV